MMVAANSVYFMNLYDLWILMTHGLNGHDFTLTMADLYSCAPSTSPRKFTGHNVSGFSDLHFICDLQQSCALHTKMMSSLFCVIRIINPIRKTVLSRNPKIIGVPHLNSPKTAAPSNDAVAPGPPRAGAGAPCRRWRLPLRGGAERRHGAGAANAAAPELRGPRRALHGCGRDATAGTDGSGRELGEGAQTSQTKQFSCFFVTFGGFWEGLTPSKM